MDPAANLVGPGCAGYAEAVPDGDGSIEGMSQDPVAVAASNNPMLTTLVAAVSGQLNPEVDLVDTLNGDEFTVFAPVDDAFAKIDPATIEALKTDTETLTSILTYHVVPGQIEPADIAGTHTTVQGADLEVTGSGDEWMVNDAHGHLRRRADRQRDRVPHRHGADAAGTVTDRRPRPAGRSGGRRGRRCLARSAPAAFVRARASATHAARRQGFVPHVRAAYRRSVLGRLGVAPGDAHAGGEDHD